MAVEITMKELLEAGVHFGHQTRRWNPKMKAEGLMTRDSRQKERKKYGQKGARKRFQFSKR